MRGRTKSEKRERTVVEQSRLTAGAQKFRKILAREMKARHLGKKFPNALLILLALSKQTKNVLKTVFGDDEEKKDEAKAALIAAYRARKPRAAPVPGRRRRRSPNRRRRSERIRREVSPRQLRIETRNYRRRTDRRMQKWMTHTKLHIIIFNDINFSTNRIKECFGSSKTRSSPVMRWLGFCKSGALAATAQARGHICPKGGP